MPLYLGGEGPKSLAFAGRSGEGVLLTAALSEEEIARSCEIVTGARNVGVVPTPLEIIAILIAATGEGSDHRVRREVLRWDKPEGVVVGVAGEADAIARAILSLTDLGVTAVAIQPTDDEPDLEGFIEFLGSKVRSLLQPTVVSDHGHA